MRRFLFIVENGQITSNREVKPEEFFEREIEFDHITQRINRIIVNATDWEHARDMANDALERSNRNR